MIRIETMSVFRSAMKFGKASLAFGFCLMAALAGAPAHAEQSSPDALDLAVGTELLALEDVRIARADISKGAKLMVTKLQLREGQLAAVDVALSDGHVVKKVAVSTILNYFRVLSER